MTKLHFSEKMGNGVEIVRENAEQNIEKFRHAIRHGLAAET